MVIRRGDVTDIAWVLHGWKFSLYGRRATKYVTATSQITVLACHITINNELIRCKEFLAAVEKGILEIDQKKYWRSCQKALGGFRKGELEESVMAPISRIQAESKSYALFVNEPDIEFFTYILVYHWRMSSLRPVTYGMITKGLYFSPHFLSCAC